MSETHTEGAAPPPKSKAYQWLKHDVSEDLSAMMFLPMVVVGIDRMLRNFAWAQPDGSCSVPVEQFKTICAREDLNEKEVWRTLARTGRWRLSEDKRVIEALFLFRLRGRVDQIVEERTKAARSAVAKRREKAAPKKRARARRAPAVPTSESETETGDRNPIPSNALTNCSPIADQKEGRKEGELQPPPALSGLGGGVVPAVPVGTAVSAAAASHAGGAAAALTRDEPPAKRDLDLPPVYCEVNIAATEPPAGWMPADVAQLVAVLDRAQTGVDVERALYALCAIHQRAKGSEAHRPLMNELQSILDGTGGRDRLIAREHAPRAAALALHGANATTTPVSPLRFRAIAVTTLRELPTDANAAESRRIAAHVGYGFDTGRLHATGFAVQDETEQSQPHAQDRRFGHTVRQEAA